ncbi:hypothetical protein [Leptodesmis sichuanensis]|uniref:hypothetical protein n=1 Tax=Leptodesmis sichuanensis TaxID=2906798 RepID=UPI001F2C5703|nr:hypothetical protein [Leptodesmis sichuanensis]UIE38360.1 hypothetical protein KIK02_01490 [Leptodesmis sichuanensis A121]
MKPNRIKLCRVFCIFGPQKRRGNRRGYDGKVNLADPSRFTRPDEQTCALRSLVRYRDVLLRYRASHIQHIQKALQQMNLKLTNVLSDIVGRTGLCILRDIVAGVRDPQQLAQHRDCRCGKTEAEIAKSFTASHSSSNDSSEKPSRHRPTSCTLPTSWR